MALTAWHAATQHADHTASFTLVPGQRLSFSGPADRYRKNVAALQLLRKLQADERSSADLTDDERLTLAHYSAFGDSALLRRAFEQSSQVTPLLSESEQAHIRRTALTAFYTPVELLHVLWAALAPALRSLPTPIRLLEPAFGIGLFLASMPADLRARAQVTAVELDQVSSQIAQLLHPDVLLYGGQGFESTDLPEAAYDLVATNVPFGEIGVFDPRMQDAFLCRTIHDYFIARALTLVRPGGLVVVLTSYGTLDKRDSRVRAWLAERAELITALRLPQGVFSANAGTECGADILILRRHTAPDQEQPQPVWVESTVAQLSIVEDPHGHFTNGSRLHTRDNDERSADTGGLRVSGYFLEHPQQVIGTLGMVRNHGMLWQAVLPPAGDLTEHIRARLQLAADLLPPRTPAQLASIPVSAPPTPPLSPRAEGLLAIYQAAKAVIALDTRGQDAYEAREELNHVYDAFVTVYGPIHARANLQALRGEPEGLFLKALETDVRHSAGQVLVRKAVLFERPTIRPQPELHLGQISADEALLWCLDERGRIELARIAELCGSSPDEVPTALAGRIFLVPGTDQYVPADEYLSGNIREKLATARTAAEHDPRFQAHVSALEAVLPTPLTPGQIRAKLGAPWVPIDVVEAFITSILPVFPRAGGTVRYVAPLAKWIVTTNDKLTGQQATVEWGTARINAVAILEAALNQRSPVVHDLDEHGKRSFNRKDTIVAREKVQRVRDAWYWGSGKIPAALNGSARSTTTCSIPGVAVISMARICDCRA